MQEKKVTGYIKPFIPRMCGGFAVKLIGTLFDLGIPWVLSMIVDEVLPSGDFNLAITWGVIMVLFCIGAWIGNVTANRMASGVSKDITRRLRGDTFRKITTLSNRQVDKLTIPSLISRMTSDTYIIHQTCSMLQRMGIRAPIMLIGGIAITLTMDPVLTLIMMTMLPIAAVISFKVKNKGRSLFRRVQGASDDMLMTVRENVTGVRVIKALSKAEYERKRFDKVNTELMTKEKTAETFMAMVNPMMGAILNLGLVTVIAVGSWRVYNGDSEIGKIIAFMNYFTLIHQSLMAITRIFTSISRASASSGRIEEVLNSPEDLKMEMPGENEEEKVPSTAHIEFRNVSFKYEKSNFEMNNLNFAVNRGETLGIIGATGSGKSTIIQLLMRFYDVTDGEIFIDGKNIKYYEEAELKRKFGAAFQNDTIFKDTIRENIAFGRDNANIELATEIAQAKEFIEERGGLDTEVAIKGADLSGGQKQRLLISRAVAANPDILVLDDSSSALDYKTDSLMREKLRNHRADTTKVIVTQRVSSIKHAETIIVLENGQIIGIGNHDFLINNCEVYREIADSQMKL
ncbi:MAG: ABC transporter ATP-binding protein [Clostridia bacterium]|nr:ABC transporter ATP-binding protein [Clostridia bacterium]